MGAIGGTACSERSGSRTVKGRSFSVDYRNLFRGLEDVRKVGGNMS